MNHLAQRIKQLRRDRGMTQQQLNEIAGVTSVPMIESGKRVSPSIGTVTAIARALGVTVDELCAEPVPETDSAA